MAALFAGIDPGLGGAVAFCNPDSGFLEVHDMPTHEIVVGGKRRQRLNIPGLLALLGDHGEDHVEVLFLEQVGPTPRDSRAGAFAFGEVFGAIRGCVYASRIRLEQVTPQRWKRAHRIGAGKDEARALAASLFPDHRELFARKKDDGRAEAALLALYAAQLWRGEK